MMLLVSKYCSSETINPRDVYFPIMTEEQFRKWQNKNHSRQLSPIILEMLEKFQPFVRDSNTLSTLQDLNNIDKHRNLLVSAINYESINLLSMFDQQSLAAITSRHGDTMAGMASQLWIRDKNMHQAVTIGQEVTRYKASSTPSNPLIQFNFSVIEKGLETRPVNTLLTEIDQEVTSVHKAFKPLL